MFLPQAGFEKINEEARRTGGKVFANPRLSLIHILLRGGWLRLSDGRRHRLRRDRLLHNRLRLVLRLYGRLRRLRPVSYTHLSRETMAHRSNTRR